MYSNAVYYKEHMLNPVTDTAVECDSCGDRDALRRYDYMDNLYVDDDHVILCQHCFISETKTLYQLQEEKKKTKRKKATEIKAKEMKKEEEQEEGAHQKKKTKKVAPQEKKKKNNFLEDQVLCHSDRCAHIFTPFKYNKVYNKYYCDSCLSCSQCNEVIKDGGVDVKNIVQGTLICGKCLTEKKKKENNNNNNKTVKREVDFTDLREL
jgi:hypothetical protein